MVHNLIFINSFQFLSCSLESLVKNLGKDEFKYLSLEFSNKALYLLKEIQFYFYWYMSDFEKFKKSFRNKEKFYFSLTDNKIQ